MSEVRIKLADHLAAQWSAAADLRGLSLTSFITATVSEALLKSGELSAAPAPPPRATQKKVSSIFESAPAPSVLDISPEGREEMFAEWDDGTADDDG